MGLLLWGAAEADAPQQAGGVGEALSSLSGSYRALLAGGLGLFGAFSFVQAVYRRITNPEIRRRFAR